MFSLCCGLGRFGVLKILLEQIESLWTSDVSLLFMEPAQLDMQWELSLVFSVMIILQSVVWHERLGCCDQLISCEIVCRMLIFIDLLARC